jgi:hypothetical protein
MIKLKTILIEQKLIEAPVADQPPAIHFVVPHQTHAYSKSAADGAGKPYAQNNIDFSGMGDRGDLSAKAANIIKKFENSQENPRGGYNKSKKLWFPHASLEGGSGTIAYGHKIQNGEDFSKGISDDDAMKLLDKDINIKINTAKSHIKGFDQMPLTVRIAVINALYRGDLGPKTMALLASHDFSGAAREYLNHQEYKSTSNRGVKKRMEWNAKVLAGAA